MFVENLTIEQRKEIVRNIVPKTVYRFQTEWRHDKEPYIEIFLYDREDGNYAVCLYDTYLTCKYRGCNYKLKEMAGKSFKELYKIFGEDYKAYFMEQVNKIFE